MADRPPELLPLHDFLSQLQAWQTDQSSEQLERLRASVTRIAHAYGSSGVQLEVDIPPLVPLMLGTGTLRDCERPAGMTAHALALPPEAAGTAELVVDGQYAAINRLIDAIELSLSAVWSLEQSTAQQRQLEALDLAVGGIASIAPVDTVLQLIVDRVRELAGAQYAALGIVGMFGHIEQFITSGISDELRAQLGDPPQGHGLLGLIIREDRPLLIDDISTDPRRYGFPDHHPEMRSLIGVPVRSRGRSIGNLYMTEKQGAPSFSAEDLRLVERFALHAGIAIENAQLHEEIGRLAIVEERERISQDLHDSIIQSLYAISLSLEDLPDEIAANPAEGALRADRAIDGIHATIRDIRNFIMGLQPEMLSGAGDLVGGIRTLAAEFEANTLIDVELHIDTISAQTPPDYAAQVLAMTRETLSNIARHSAATRTWIELRERNNTLSLSIRDNGRGFDVNEPRANSHHGLSNLRSRSDSLRGTMTLTSEPGNGTRLELSMPMPGGASQTVSNPQ